MKLSKVLTIVVSAHTLVVALILFQPGCQTESARSSYPSATKQTMQGKSAISRPLPVANAGDAQNRVIVHRDFSANDRVPAANLEEIKQPSRRYQPSRPPLQQWNVIQESEPEVIAGNDYYVSESLSEFNPPIQPIPTVEPVNSGQLNPELSGEMTATYTVVKGDNLTKIARAHGIELSDLMGANGLNKKSILRIGQVLVIPNPQPGLNPKPPVAPNYETTSAEVDSSLYIVVPGDNLSKIAQKFATTVRAIKSANGLTNDRIYAGQDLLIPKNVPAATTPSPIGTSSGFAANDAGMTYKVRRGDTLGKIAHRFGVRVGDIMAANGITDPRRLRAGQTIKIPDGAVSDKSTATLAPRVTTPVQTQSAPQAYVAPVPAPKPQVVAPLPVQVDPLEEIDLDDVPHVPVYGE